MCHSNAVKLIFLSNKRSEGNQANAQIGETLSRLRALPNGLPVIVDDRWVPLEPWLTYFRVLASTCETSTLRNYAYDAFRFASFLAARGSDVVHATHQDVVDYRRSRLGDGRDGVAVQTWQREAVVIRGIFNLLKQLGLLDDVPWIVIGRTSALGSPWRSEADIRPLSTDQWRHFRDVGLAGNAMGGGLDGGWRGRNSARGIAGAELALTTGMRLCEFSSLLDMEIPNAMIGISGTSLLIESIAKFGKRRRVMVPPSTQRRVDLYRHTERRALVRRAAPRLWQERESFFVIDAANSMGGRVVGRVDGRRVAWDTHRIPRELRRRAVVEIDGGLASACLFLGQNGLPLSKRAWHQVFASASARAQQADPRPADHRVGRRVTPHDLRHTFAVVMLQQATRTAIAGEHDRRDGKLRPGGLSEHIIKNPLLTVQRMLGHSSPQTTLVYLRFIEDTETLVRDAFEEWNDPAIDYAEYIERERGVDDYGFSSRTKV